VTRGRLEQTGRRKTCKGSQALTSSENDTDTVLHGKDVLLQADKH
jgi:hypothetical protein